jgi:hypothetical protein
MAVGTLGLVLLLAQADVGASRSWAEQLQTGSPQERDNASCHYARAESIAPELIPGLVQEVVRHAFASEIPVDCKYLCGACALSRGEAAGVAVQAVLARAGDPSISFDQDHLVWVLGRLGPKAVPDLAERLKHGEPLVRYLAARTLGQLMPSSEAVVLPLRRALGDEASSVREAAAQALEGLNYGPPAKKKSASPRPRSDKRAHTIRCPTGQGAVR